MRTTSKALRVVRGVLAVVAAALVTSRELPASRRSLPQLGVELTANGWVLKRVSILTNGTDILANAGTISGNGRYVAFARWYWGHWPPVFDNNPLYLHDRDTGATTRLTGRSGNDTGYAPGLSADGRVLVFTSKATGLVPGDTNNVRDVFLHYRATASTIRVSVATNGAQGNGDSVGGRISADGIRVVFWSNASNLVAGDTNGVADVFVRDTRARTTTRVSVAASGAQLRTPSTDAAISADGQVVAFVTGSGTAAALYTRHLQTGVTRRVGPATRPGTDFPLVPVTALSADGRVVVWATNRRVLTGDTNEASDVYVFDAATRAISCVSVDPDLGTPFPGKLDSAEPSIDASGRFVALASEAPLAPGNAGDGWWSVFLHDRDSNTTTRVSVSNNDSSSGSGWGPSLSADGGSLAFDSRRGDLAPNRVPTAGDYRDTDYIYVASAPRVADPSLAMALRGSGSGSVASEPSGLRCPPTCEALFPYGTVVHLSAVAAPGSRFAGWSGSCRGDGAETSVAADAHKKCVARFEAGAPTLVLKNTLDYPLLRGWRTAYQLQASAVGVVDIGRVTVTDVLPAGLSYEYFGGTGWTCQATGQRVTCEFQPGDTPRASTSVLALSVRVSAPIGSNVTHCATVARDANQRADRTVRACHTARVYNPHDYPPSLYFLMVQAPRLVSVPQVLFRGSVETSDDFDIPMGAISIKAQGRTVFRIHTRSRGVKWRALVAGLAPGINRIRFEVTGENGAHDTLQKTVVYKPAPTPAASTERVDTSSSSASLSADGRLIVFDSTNDSLVPDDRNGVSDVFLRDTGKGTTVRVSVPGASGEPDGASTLPHVYAPKKGSDAHVAFVSTASNLVPADTNGLADAFVVTVGAAGTVGAPRRVSVASDGTQGNGAVTGPPAIGTGEVGLQVAFASAATNLIPLDANGYTDVFAHTLSSGATNRVTRGAANQEADFESELAGFADGNLGVISRASNMEADRQREGRANLYLYHGPSWYGPHRLNTAADWGLPNAGVSDGHSNGSYNYTYSSSASNLVPDDTNGKIDVFVGMGLRVSVSSAGQQANGDSRHPYISGNGRFVVFESEASNLVPHDTNGVADCLLADLDTGIVRRINVSSAGVQANGACSTTAPPSNDGRVVLFYSNATNLVPGGPNGQALYVWKRE